MSNLEKKLSIAKAIIEVIDKTLGAVKKHWVIIAAITAGVGTNGLHVVRGHDLSIQVEAEQAASKIYANLVAEATLNTQPVVRQGHTHKAHNHIAILKRLSAVEVITGANH